MKYILIAVPEILWYENRHRAESSVRWYGYTKGGNGYKVAAVRFSDYRLESCGGLDTEKLAAVVGNLQDKRIELQVCEDPAALATTLGMLPDSVRVVPE